MLSLVSAIHVQPSNYAPFTCQIRRINPYTKRPLSRTAPLPSHTPPQQPLYRPTPLPNSPFTERHLPRANDPSARLTLCRTVPLSNGPSVAGPSTGRPSLSAVPAGGRDRMDGRICPHFRRLCLRLMPAKRSQTCDKCRRTGHKNGAPPTRATRRRGARGTYRHVWDGADGDSGWSWLPVDLGEGEGTCVVW